MFRQPQGQTVPPAETDLSAIRFRANPDYELILFDRLSREQQDLLRGLQDDPDFYGILRPRAGPSLGVKSVDRQAALLYLTMQQAGPLPQYVQRMLGQGAAAAIAELVLDGVLEMELQGSFVSGAATAAFFVDQRSPADARGRNAALSIAALKYGQALALDDVRQLSHRLYGYHRGPLTPHWRHRLPDADAVLEYLGLDRDGPISKTLSKVWIAQPAGARQTGWRSWRARRQSALAREEPTTYKLYISPSVEHIKEALSAFVASSGELQAFAFKIGRDAYGLLRPDKLIAYFHHFDDLAEAAERLRRRLDGCPAHGVPFTAGVTPDGLLSWGMDPPKHAQTPLLKHGESWRLWLTNRLASALVAARSPSAQQVEPWQFALHRLALDGVDTNTWAPAGHIWRDARSTEA